MSGYNYLRDSGKAVYICTVHGRIKPELQDLLENEELENFASNDKQFSFTSKPEDFDKLLERIEKIKTNTVTLFMKFTQAI